MTVTSTDLVVTGGMDRALLAYSREQVFVPLSSYPTLAEAFQARKALLAYAATLGLTDSVAPSITKAA